jgi:hypothetical protein
MWLNSQKEDGEVEHGNKSPSGEKNSPDEQSNEGDGYEQENISEGAILGELGRRDFDGGRLRTHSFGE